MVCYIVPLIATAGGVISRKALKKHDLHSLWLNIMLLGGSMFGLIDHMWHGELFLLGANWMMDLALGTTITSGIFITWGLVVYKNHLFEPFRNMSRRTGIYK